MGTLRQAQRTQIPFRLPSDLVSPLGVAPVPVVAQFPYGVAYRRTHNPRLMRIFPRSRHRGGSATLREIFERYSSRPHKNALELMLEVGR